MTAGLICAKCEKPMQRRPTKVSGGSGTTASPTPSDFYPWRQGMTCLYLRAVSE